MSKRSNVFTHYLGQPLGNSQDPDEPNDRSATRDGGYRIGGKGAQGGGAKPLAKAQRGLGSGKLAGSYPKNTQKIRG